jgi:two-component system, cell cycle sensor histidine kinase and response regulator CckA
LALNILLLEDAESDAELIRRALRREGFDSRLTHVAGKDDYVRALVGESYDVILSDYRLPGFDGTQALAAAQRACPETPFILVSGTVGEDVVVDLLRDGVTDFVLKHQLARLGPAVRRALQATQERAARREAEETLAESLRFTQSIIDASPALVYVLDRTQSRSLFVNEEARRLGYTAEQLHAMGPDLIGHLMHPEDAQRIARAREGLAAMPKDEALELDFRLRNARGEWRWFHAREVRFASEGRTQQVLGIAQDMTAAKLAESRRAAQYAVTRALAESVSWREAVPRVLDVLRQQLGASVVELWYEDGPGGLRFSGVSHAEPASAESWAQASRDLTFAPGPGVSELVWETRQASWNAHVGGGGEAVLRGTAPAGTLAVAIRSGESTPGVIVFFGLAPEEHDADLLALLEGVGSQLGEFRERRRAEERVREQAALLEHAREAIIVTGLDHRVRFWNRGAATLYGIEEAQALGQDAGGLLGSRNESDLQEARERVLAVGEWAGLIEQRGRGSQVMKVQSHWTLVRDPSGTPHSILIINADVTERKRLETELLRSQRMDSLGVLAGGIAHDLNNVLAPILMALDALKKRATDDRSLRMFELLEASAQRGADLVRQILGFARGAEGQRLLLDPPHLVLELEKMVREALPMTVNLKIDLPEALWHVSGDPTQLHQVLLNLCVNARDAMPDGGTLGITAQNVEIDARFARTIAGARAGKYVLFKVTDTGSGIPADVIDRIFEPFFTTKEHGRGTGLGLSTAMTIVNAHEGFVMVSSEPGQGSTFSVYIPAAIAGERPAVAKVPELPRGNGQVILVADDEVSIREIAKEALEAFGYVPVLAVNGAEAVSMCVERPDIQAVLMDVQMPVMDGNAATRVLHKMGRDVKVIAVSGFADYQPQSMSSGACLFLVKPYTASQLLSALRTALGT